MLLPDKLPFTILRVLMAEFEPLRRATPVPIPDPASFATVVVLPRTSALRMVMIPIVESPLAAAPVPIPDAPRAFPVWLLPLTFPVTIVSFSIRDVEPLT
jgi:hypothetical protein